MPYKPSNIPDKTFCSATHSEMLQIFKTTTKFLGFIKSP